MRRFMFFKDTLKSDDVMFLPLAKAMRLRRDVCLRHVADKNTIAKHYTL